eukprot:1195106-Prorocentrum_minimum.AAC.1
MYTCAPQRLHCTRKVYSDRTLEYSLDGPVFFGSSHKLVTFFNTAEDRGDQLVLDMTKCNVLDGSAVAAIRAVEKK